LARGQVKKAQEQLEMAKSKWEGHV
jgi:hypothetical protein